MRLCGSAVMEPSRLDEPYILLVFFENCGKTVAISV
jgi:hypothetical protein